MKKEGSRIAAGKKGGTKSEELKQRGTAKAVACTALAVRVFKGIGSVLATAKAVGAHRFSGSDPEKAQNLIFQCNFEENLIYTRF